MADRHVCDQKETMSPKAVSFNQMFLYNRQLLTTRQNKRNDWQLSVHTTGNVADSQLKAHIKHYCNKQLKYSCWVKTTKTMA